MDEAHKPIATQYYTPSPKPFIVVVVVVVAAAAATRTYVLYSYPSWYFSLT
jgi:hypothetical protein